MLLGGAYPQVEILKAKITQASLDIRCVLLIFQQFKSYGLIGVNKNRV